MRVSATIRLALSGLLLAAGLSAGAARAAEIILYPGFDFTGAPLRLTQSTPAFGDFDNRANSVRVVSGTWELFYDTNYQSDFGPSKLLGPGDYFLHPRSAQSGLGILPIP